MADFHPLRSLRDDDDDDSEWEALNQLAAQLAASQPTAPVPSLAHLSYRDYDHVYEPSHDTYLLLDALQYELRRASSSSSSAIARHRSPAWRLAVDRVWRPSLFARSGGGCSLRSMGTLRMMRRADGPPPLLSYVTDVNPRALQVTRETFRQAARQR